MLLFDNIWSTLNIYWFISIRIRYQRIAIHLFSTIHNIQSGIWWVIMKVILNYLPLPSCASVKMNVIPGLTFSSKNEDYKLLHSDSRLLGLPSKIRLGQLCLLVKTPMSWYKQFYIVGPRVRPTKRRIKFSTFFDRWSKKGKNGATTLSTII